MNDSVALPQKPVMKRFRSPGTVIARFTTKRNLRTASLWALVLGAYVASKAIGFVKAYPTEIGRQKAVEAFSSNTGLAALLGPVPSNGSTDSYVTWSTYSLMVIIGSIWMMLLATKLLRGEADAGRWEILLTGQTTARRAVLNVLGGLTACLLIFYVILSIVLSAIGSYKGLNFDSASASYYALAVVAGAGFFMLVGGLASQIMSTRAKASGVAVAVFGASYLLRAIGDITSSHWVLNLTPLGWLEKLQPLSKTDPVWFIPLIGIGLVMLGLTIYFAGVLDLGDSVVADRPTSKPHTKLLNSPFFAALKLTRATSISWLFGIFVSAVLYSSLTKSITGAFVGTKGARHIFTKLAHQSQISIAVAYLGVVFLIQMIVIMLYAANSVSAIRRDEAEGYTDNMLVQPISRSRWLGGRLALASLVAILAGALTYVAVWVGIRSQNYGIGTHTLILATINMLVPVSLLIGLAVFTFGIRPRLTSFIAYGLVAWSFLIDIVSSGINLNHWILDTSILNQMKFAPAASPVWRTNLVMFVLAVVLSAIGFVAFKFRDLESE